MSEPVAKVTTRAGRRRHPRLIAAGLLCVTLGGLGAAALHNSTHQTRPAVAMARDVTRGQVIRAEDLKIAEAPPGMPNHIPSTELDSLVGRTAGFDLPTDAFPSQRLLGMDPLPEGSAIVGLSLGPGRIPAREIVPGQAVQLVSLVDGTAVDAIVVTAPRLLDDHTTRLIDVALPVEKASAVASLSAQEQLVLYVVGIR
ncbi:SAF domain-containing protein [Arachnia propionica]|uniref:SAF domain-containing protein n=1 Tax=Arachnia propionica TaxID=1750 RepID=A0A3P1WYN1_9ACTN|nr:SAF domain-containing protein [Arachnia propionica]RRD49523.1 hypothetical protein EII35_07940 [Arachnia propionica]